MNIIKYIIDYFKKIRSRFRKSTRNETVFQRIKENDNKQIKEIDKRLKDLLRNKDENVEEIKRVIEEKTAIEISQGLGLKYEEPVFDLAEIEEEVNVLNQKLFDIELRKQRIDLIKIPPTSKTDEDINKLEKIFQGLSSKKKFHSDSVFLNGLNEDKTNVDSFFEEFRLIKVYRNREEKREREEQLKQLKLKDLLRQLELTINSNKNSQAKQNIRIAEKVILGLKDSKQKTKFRTKLSSLIVIFRKKEIEEEAKRQAKKLEQERKKSEKKRKKEEEKRKEERKKGIIVDDISKNNILQQFQISGFYHMTAIPNLESILRHDLLSHSEAYRQNFVNTDISDNEVNNRRQRQEPINNRKIHDYVPFYFNPKNPMLYRRKNLQDSIVILEVDRRLIYQMNNLFTDGNAASNSTKFYNQIKNLKKIDWTGIKREYWHDHPDGKRIRCAEVLAYPKISKNYILKIHCNNMNTMEKVRVIVRNCGLDIPCNLSSKYYF